jgi:hypothetical protein
MLRGVYGAMACSVYLTGQRAIFGQSLPMKDITKVAMSCGLRAMGMSVVMGGLRDLCKAYIPNTDAKLKDGSEAVILSAGESLFSYVQDKTTAKDVSPLKVLGLSTLKSIPNSFMDTPSYDHLIDYLSNKTGFSKSWNKNFMNGLSAFVTAIPATFLNNEPFTPINFAKTYGLRLASVQLWRSAMDTAKKHSGVNDTN